MSTKEILQSPQKGDILKSPSGDEIVYYDGEQWVNYYRTNVLHKYFNEMIARLQRNSVKVNNQSQEITQ